MSQKQCLIWSLRISIFSVLMIALSSCNPFNTIHEARQAARNSQCYGCMDAIYHLLRELRYEPGHYPPVAKRGQNGKPMTSWRSQVYLQGSRPPVIRYKIDEPWDSPANQQVAKTLPLMMYCENDQAALPRFTNYVAVIEQGISTFEKADKLPDGSPELAKQPLIIEYPNSDIGWTEPRDLDVTELHKLGEPKDPKGLGVMFADGTFRRMSRVEVLKLFGR